MSPAQAVELAYVIAEHGRAQKLLDALVDAADCTLPYDGGLQLCINRAGVVTCVDMPHMLMRRMFRNGTLVHSLGRYLDQLNAELKDQVGIVIEEESPPLNQTHQGSEPE